MRKFKRLLSVIVIIMVLFTFVTEPIFADPLTLTITAAEAAGAAGLLPLAVFILGSAGVVILGTYSIEYIHKNAMNLFYSGLTSGTLATLKAIQARKNAQGVVTVTPAEMRAVVPELAKVLGSNYAAEKTAVVPNFMTSDFKYVQGTTATPLVFAPLSKYKIASKSGGPVSVHIEATRGIEVIGNYTLARITYRIQAIDMRNGVKCDTGVYTVWNQIGVASATVSMFAGTVIPADWYESKYFMSNKINAFMTPLNTVFSAVTWDMLFPSVSSSWDYQGAPMTVPAEGIDIKIPANPVNIRVADYAPSVPQDYTNTRQIGAMTDELANVTVDNPTISTDLSAGETVNTDTPATTTDTTNPLDLSIPSSGALDWSPLLNITNVTTVFPFSLPWDLANIFKVFNSDPQPIRYQFTFKIPTLGISYPMDMDFTPFDGIAKIIRVFTLLIFSVFLLTKSKSMIWG